MNAPDVTEQPTAMPAVGCSAGLADEWTSYQPTRAREKTFYDIKLRNGEVVECCYPNGNSWHPMHPNKRSGHTRLPDYRVLEIRKCQHPMDIADESSANDQAQ